MAPVRGDLVELCLDPAEPIFEPMDASQEILILVREHFQPLFDAVKTDFEDLVFGLEFVQLVRRSRRSARSSRRTAALIRALDDTLDIGKDDLAVELRERRRENGKGHGLVGHRAHGTPFRFGRIAEMASARPEGESDQPPTSCTRTRTG